MDIGLLKASFGPWGELQLEAHLLGMLPCALKHDGYSVEGCYHVMRKHHDTASFARYASNSCRTMLTTCLDVLDCMRQGVDYESNEVWTSSFMQAFAQRCFFFFNFECEDADGKILKWVGQDGIKSALEWLQKDEVLDNTDFASSILEDVNPVKLLLTCDQRAVLGDVEVKVFANMTGAPQLGMPCFQSSAVVPYQPGMPASSGSARVDTDIAALLFSAASAHSVNDSAKAASKRARIAE